MWDRGDHVMHVTHINFELPVLGDYKIVYFRFPSFSTLLRHKTRMTMNTPGEFYRLIQVFIAILQNK